SACLRPQDSLGCLACKAYVKNGRLVFVLPPVGKNSRTLVKSVIGMVVNHAKDERTTGPFAVMLVIGRRLMRMRLQENYKAACAEQQLAREQQRDAEGRLAKAIDSDEFSEDDARRDLAAASESFKRADKEVQQYAPRDSEKADQEDRVRNRRRRQARVLQFAELGDKAAPFTKYGKNYNDGQLRSMYLHVGKYALGLPAFGPNILRTIHVTTVMTVCYTLGIPQSDDRVLNHFALARHGEYEMRKAYNLAKSDNVNDDPNSFSRQISGIISAQELNNRSCLSDKDAIRDQQHDALNTWIGDS
ncbi:unnamed protein product, partial [Hapterophycus canaliculatus]